MKNDDVNQAGLDQPFKGIEMTRFTEPNLHVLPQREPTPDEMPLPVDPDPGPTPTSCPTTQVEMA